MVVCKYYLEGRCRFGNECRFEHGLQERKGSENLSYRQNQRSQQQQPQQYFGNLQTQPQRYFPNQPKQQSYFGQQPAQQQQVSRHISNQIPGITEAQLDTYKKLVEKDALEWEHGNQWPFSVYAPLLRRVLTNQKNGQNKNKEYLPVLEEFEYSQEELRWEAMSALSAGTFQIYCTGVQTMLEKIQRVRRGLQNMDPATANYILAYECGEDVSSAGTVLETSISSVMPSQHLTQLPQQPVKSSFSFSLPQQPNASFQKPPDAGFRFQLNNNVPQQTEQTVFKQQPVPQQFFQQQQPSSVQQPAQQQSVFHQPPQTTNNPNNGSQFYPTLSQTDLEQFKGEKFSFGCIPRQPPPKEFR